MNKKHEHHSSNNHGHEHEHEHQHHQGPFWKRLHRDWRAWVAVLLMLAAMLAYVMSDDESLQPGGKVQQPVPAAAL
jgi:hypothetical protein